MAPSKPRRRKRRKKRLRIYYRLESISVQCLSALLGAMSYRTALALARALGVFSFHFLPIRKKVILDNLAQAFPESDETWRWQTTRECYRQVAMAFTEALRLPYLRPADLKDKLTIEGEENLREAGWKKAPFIICGAHIGGWEHTGAFFTRRGFPLAAVTKRIHNPYLDSQATETRQKFGLRVIQVSKDMRSIITHVRKERGCIIMLNDQDARKAGIFINFFGRPASTFMGPAFFALRLGIPFMPVFQFRDENDPTRHTTVFHQPIKPPANLTQDQAIRFLLEKYTRALEEAIRLHPGQYFWFHKRWKTQPKAKKTAKRNTKTNQA